MHVQVDSREESRSWAYQPQNLGRLPGYLVGRLAPFKLAKL